MDLALLNALLFGSVIFAVVILFRVLISMLKRNKWQ